jgi:hypothetical protein
MTQFTCKGVKQINNWISFKHLYHSYLSAFFISAGVPNGEFPEILIAKCRSRFYFTWFFCWGDIVQEINVSRAWDPVHAGDKALTREIPMKRGRVNRYALSCHTIFKPINSSWHQKSEPDTQIQIHSGTYRHQKTATNTHSSPGLSHFGINCLQHLPLQTQLTVSRAWSQYLPWFQFSHHNYHSYWF